MSNQLTPEREAEIMNEQPICHFTPMEWIGGEYDETWWECKHCGHTIEISTPNDFER